MLRLEFCCSNYIKSNCLVMFMSWGNVTFKNILFNRIAVPFLFQIIFEYHWGGCNCGQWQEKECYKWVDS